ncbi:hypothetical protein [Mycolicibacterium hassiacum]|uniref:hypothetical protein n=1 Tax=Mycolicibacterium hassiacum TaxID=46351 RepID=UPI00058757DC|nr:hypothetical protein [Mycolicibacterium hassiacum]
MGPWPGPPGLIPPGPPEPPEPPPSSDDGPPPPRPGFGGAGTTVVSTPEPPSGCANAGAIPPVSAVSEITTPVASAAATPRLVQN